jgi:hypothetical protein
MHFNKSRIISRPCASSSRKRNSKSAQWSRRRNPFSASPIARKRRRYLASGHHRSDGSSRQRTQPGRYPAASYGRQRAVSQSAWRRVERRGSAAALTGSPHMRLP